MRLVRANEKSRTKATIIMLVFYKDLLSGSKYGDAHAVKILILLTFNLISFRNKYVPLLHAAACRNNGNTAKYTKH